MFTLMFDVKNLNFGTSLLISLFSILVVFLVLLCISFLIDITATCLNRGKKKKEVSPANDGPHKADGAVAAADESVQPAAPEAEAGISAHTLAVIMAAIKAYEQDNKRFSVRKITRPGQMLSGWEQASIQDALRRSR